MFTLLSTLALVGCSDTEVSPVPKDQPAATDACECADVDALEQRVGELEEQLVHVQGDILDNDARISAVEEASTSSSSLVVSEYTVDCVADREPGAQTENLRGYPLAGPSGETSAYGCLVANIDITDRPYSIEISWVSDNTLTYPTYSRDLSVEMYGADWPSGFVFWTNFGNDLRYVTNAGTAYGITTASGDVYADVTPLQTDWSAAPEELPMKAIPVRVVIIHDRPYTLPTYTP